jgi:hypothetical protein
LHFERITAIIRSSDIWMTGDAYGVHKTQEYVV